MSRRIRVRRNDIVVVVPRWLIIASGLLMLMIQLVFAFMVIFAGFLDAGLIFALFSLVSVPFTLLIAYMVWLFFWQLLVVSSVAAAFFFLLMVTGFARIGGRALNPFVHMSNGAPVFGAADQLAVNLLISVILAALSVVIIGVVLQVILGPFSGSGADDTPAPRKPRQGDYPPLDDPYWDDI